MHERVEAAEHPDQLLERHRCEPAGHRRGRASGFGEGGHDVAGRLVPRGREISIVGRRGRRRNVEPAEDRAVDRYDVADEVADRPPRARSGRGPLIVGDPVDPRAEARGDPPVPLRMVRHRARR